MLWLGGGGESGVRPDQTAFVSVCVCVCVSSPESDNRAGPVPDWGQLVAAPGGGRSRSGGGRYQTPLSDLGVWIGRERLAQKKIKKNHRQLSGSQRLEEASS